MKTIIFSLDEFFKLYPHVKKSYYFLKRSWFTIIEYSLLGLNGKINWGNINEEDLNKHIEDVVSQIFSQWEEYNYVEDLSNARFLNDDKYLSLYDYTEKVVGYICNKFKTIIGSSEEPIIIKDILDDCAKHSLITVVMNTVD